MTPEPKTDVTTAPTLPHKPVVTNTKMTDGTGGNYEPKTDKCRCTPFNKDIIDTSDCDLHRGDPSKPKTDEVEEIVEEFWRKCHGESVHEDGWIGIDGFSVEKAQDWLRTTLETQADKANREREELVREILRRCEAVDGGINEFIGVHEEDIKAIATAHGIDLDT